MTAKMLCDRNYGSQNSSAMRYDWDVLNRAINILGTSTGGSYSYRADGQRVEKVEGATLLWTPTGSRDSGYYDTDYATNRPTSRYFYDGQMGFEDDYNPSGTVASVTRYALGARGLDRMEYWDGSSTTYGYPLYDGHGNMRAVLSKSGSSYSTSNWRTYDVWGSVRSGSATGDPKQKYVASLGHVADDETGLTYMRARFYEPSTGRFVSEDPAADGTNWYIYCSNIPTMLRDASGCAPWNVYENIMTALALLRFVIAIASVSDASEIEEKYGQFCSAASYSFLEDTLGLPDWVGLVSDTASVYKAYYSSVAFAVAMAFVKGNDPAMAAGMSAIMGSLKAAFETPLGAFGLQMFAYNLRLCWYLWCF